MKQSGEKKIPTPAPIKLAEREERSYTFEFLTPMFGGGVDPKAPTGDPITKIRSASVRGQLRFWWRATQGPRFRTIEEMHAEETRIFGGAASGDNEKDPSRGVAIRLDVSRLTATPTQAADEVPYFSFPLREDRQARPTAEIRGEFCLHLRFLADASSETIGQVEAAVWAFALVFLVLGDIIGRGVFASPIYGTVEMVAASVVIIVFLQAGYAIRSRSMLRADFLVTHLPKGVQRVLLAFGYLLGAAFFLMIITGGWEESIRSFVDGEFEGEGALRVPSWPARWTVLIGSALALINYCVMAYLDIFKPELLDSEVDPDAPAL